MKKPLLFALCTLCMSSAVALACDAPDLPLSGTITVPTCDAQASTDCLYSGKVVHDYLEAVPDSDTAFTIGLQSSPWRMYDGEMRILTVEDLADAIRPRLGGKKARVELIGSWTGVSPAPGVPSLADRLSGALGGIPVKGEDGFLWLAADGSRRTTRQAYSVREGAGAYFLPTGSEVFVPLSTGWASFVEDQVPEEDTGMRLLAAAGWDVLFLCPDKALDRFERVADKGDAIAAYNAALIRLERGGDGDRAAALALLARGGALGDAKSRARLAAERAKGD